MLCLMSLVILYVFGDPRALEIWRAAKRSAIEQGQWCPGRSL